MSPKDRKFLRDTLERAGKTAVQAYFVLWTLVAGIGSDLGPVNEGAFETLFALNNFKAAVVGAFYSLFTSILSRPIGEEDSASLVE